MSERFNRFIGGSPAGVLFRLILMSLLVGVVLTALGLSASDIVEGFVRLVRRISFNGFEAVNWLFEYFLVGVVLVVPIWLVIRLLRYGRRE